jgi:hypothetical protein
MSDPTTVPRQDLADGSGVQDRFSALGVATARTEVHPRYARGMVLGLPGSGKSTFLGSCPEALLINVDCTTIGNTVRAGVWPPVNERGRSLDPATGRPMKMNWTALRGLVKTLKNLAEQDKPRPDMVIIDTLPGAIELAKEEVGRQHGKAFDDMHGMKAWPYVGDLLSRLMNEVHQMGYGFWWVGHVSNKVIPIGEDEATVVLSPTFPDSIWRRLNWQLEIIVACENEWVSKKIDGKIEKVNEHRLLGRDPRYPGVVKTKNGFDHMLVDPTTGWTDFEAVCLETS